MVTQTQLYLDLPRVGEVASELRGRNVFHNQIYAQREGLVVLPDKGISRVAEFTRPENLAHHPQNQNGEWVNQQREKYGVTEKDVLDGYNQLRSEIWKKYVAQSSALLLWVPSYLVKDSGLKSTQFPMYFQSWKVPDNQMDERFWDEPNEKQRITVNSFTPVPFWLKQNGQINPEMSELLEASADTSVFTAPDPKFYVGARALGRGFGDREWPYLFSYWGPWVEGFVWGSLLGRNLDESLIEEIKK